MNQSYNCLSDLLSGDAEARDAFAQLPGYVQETLRQRGDHVCTRDALLSYADKLTRGDD